MSSAKLPLLPVLAPDGLPQQAIELAAVVEAGEAVANGHVLRSLQELDRGERGRRLVADELQDAARRRVEGAAAAREDEGAQGLVARPERHGQQRLGAPRALVEDQDRHAVLLPAQVVEGNRRLGAPHDPGRPGLLREPDLAPFELVGPALGRLDHVARLELVGHHDGRALEGDELLGATEQVAANRGRVLLGRELAGLGVDGRELGAVVLEALGGSRAGQGFPRRGRRSPRGPRARPR